MSESKRNKSGAAWNLGDSFGIPSQQSGQMGKTFSEIRKQRNLKREEEKRNQIRRRIAIVLFSVCFLIGAFFLTWEYLKERRTQSANLTLMALLNEPELAEVEVKAPLSGNVEETVKAENAGYMEEKLKTNNIQAILQMNPDFVGWIRVHCLYRIDNPVFQRDNVYYLSHDAVGEKDKEGSVFVDENSLLNPRDGNVILYAHNCASGAKFGTLYQMANLEYLSRDPFVTLGVITQENEYREDLYVPFAALRTTVGYREEEFDFLVRNFKDEASFQYYYGKAVEKSLIPDAVGCTFQDSLLTLVTCSDRAGESRFVVLLRRVREEEDPEQLKQRFLQLN